MADNQAGSAQGAAGGVASGLANLKGKLPGGTIVPVIIAASALLGILAALWMWANQTVYRPLYSGLSEEAGGEVIAELESRGIPYKINERGDSILVSSDEVHKTRLSLAEKGIPKTADKGFSILDDQRFGISQFAEKVNFQRAIEGELAASILTLRSIDAARVHLAMARPNVFARHEKPAKASVIVNIAPGASLSNEDARAITFLVARSVPDLSANDVSIVDQSGRLYDPNMVSNEDAAKDHRTIVRLIESDHEMRVEEILSPLFGRQNVKVKMTADVDFTVEEVTSEQYRPNQEEGSAAVRSAQLRSSRDGKGVDARGVPGALSNTPPGWAPSPISNADEEAGAGGDDDVGDYSKTVNYEVDRSIKHTKKTPGQVQRMTAAVVINQRQEPNEDGVLVPVPFTPEEIENIRELVKQAMGFNAARGDEIHIVGGVFAEPAYGTDEFDNSPWWMDARVLAMADQWIRYIMFFVLAFILYRLVLRPVLARHKAAMMAKAAEAMAAAGADPMSQQMISEGDFKNQFPDYFKKYEERLKEMKSVAEREPKVVAMVVNSWMDQEKTNGPA